jgi:hypothetical protein
MLRRLLSSIFAGKGGSGARESHREPIRLEEQLDKLARLGLTLAEGITIDDMLHSFGREDYEKEPFDLVLFVLGIEVERAPWGRRFCTRVWNFDTECIEDHGAYVEIVRRLSEVAGRADRITDLEDFVDLEAGEAWLQYRIDGQPRRWEIEINDDWADPRTVTEVMADLEGDGKRFYGKDNGQVSVLFCLDDESAAQLNAWSGNALSPMVG